MAGTPGFFKLLGETKKGDEELGIQRQHIPTLLIVIILAIAIIVIIHTGWDITNIGNDPGVAAAEEYIFEYIDILNKNDAEDMGKFLGASADSQDIHDRLEHHGGLNLTDVKVTIRQEFPYIYRVWINATDRNNERVEMYQIIEWNGKRWKMAPLYTGPSPRV